MRAVLSSATPSPTCWPRPGMRRSEEHTSELQSLQHLVCRLLLEKKCGQPQRRARRRGVVEGLRTRPDVHGRPRALSPPLRPARREPRPPRPFLPFFFFFNDPATTEIYPLSLHAALPISDRAASEHAGIDEVFGSPQFVGGPKAV